MARLRSAEWRSLARTFSSIATGPPQRRSAQVRIDPPLLDGTRELPAQRNGARVDERIGRHGACVASRATDAKLSPEGSEPTIPNTSTGPLFSSNPMSEIDLADFERQPMMGRVARRRRAIGEHHRRAGRFEIDRRELGDVVLAGAPARLRRAFSTAASRTD